MKMMIRSSRAMLFAGALSCALLAGPVVEAASAHRPPETEAEQIAKIKNDPKLTESQKALLIAHVPEDVARDRQEVRDRQELVLPAPANWKPENERRKLKLTLIPEKSKIHVGDIFRYRVESQNVGHETLWITEDYPGFIKDGQLSDHWYGFNVTPPGGKEKRLMIPFPRPSSGIVKVHEIFPAGNTQAEKDASFARMQIESRSAANLSLSLESGETLLTRADSPADKFRDLKANFSFSKPGIYRVKVVYDDRPLPAPSEADVQDLVKSGVSRKAQKAMRDQEIRDSLGLVESNEVDLEVRP